MKKQLLILLSILLMNIALTAQVNSFQEYIFTGVNSGLQIAMDFQTDKLIQERFLFASNKRDSAQFIFTLQTTSDGYFAVKVRHPNFGNLYWKTTDQGEITLSNNNQLPENHFKLTYEASRGAYYIESKAHTNQVLDVFGASRDAGAKITLYGKAGSINQFFHLEKLNANKKQKSEFVTNNCTEIIETSMGGGTVFSVLDNNASVYDSIYLKDTSSFFIYVLDTLGQMSGNWEEEYLQHYSENGCITGGGRKIYLDGESIGNSFYQNMDELVRRISKQYFPFLDAQGNHQPLKKGGVHLITIVSPTGRTFYIPFAIVNVPFISGILGTTITPEIPKMVIHDPPGDGSSATLEKGERICYGESISLQTDEGGEFGLSARVGVKGSLGFIAETEYEAYAEVTASLTMGTRVNQEGSSEFCLEASESYSTSEGFHEDIFIGVSQEMAYGIQGTLAYDFFNDRCYYQEPQFVVAPVRGGYKSTFVWTESYMIDEFNRQLEKSNDTTLTEFERDQHNEQAITFAQFLILNIINRAEAEALNDKNFSFSGGTGPTTFSESMSTTESASYGVAMYIDASVAAEVGAYVGGSGGSASAKVYMNHEIGRSKSNTREVINTLSYTLIDENTEDFFNVIVKEDQLFGTPVFELDDRSRTSCPHEGGYALDQPDLGIKIQGKGSFRDKAVASGIGADQAVTFELRLENKSDQQRHYSLKADIAEITQGTEIALNGDDGFLSSGGIAPFDLESGAERIVLVQVSKGSSSSSNHHGPIPIILYSTCDENIESIVNLEVLFEDVTSSHDLINQNLAFHIAPNPAADYFNLNFHKLREDARIEIIDLNGQCIKNITAQAGIGSQKIFTEGMIKGIFQIRIVDSNGFYVRKVIIQ